MAASGEPCTDGAPPVRKAAGSRALRVLGTIVLAFLATIAAREFAWLVSAVAFAALLVVKAVLIDSDPRARWLAGFLDSGKAVRRAAAE